MIPARSGSKRIPQKNIANLAGYPLIYWTIKAAKDSPFIGRVIVSTDSTEIAAMAKQFGAEAPFLRPTEISTDDSLGLSVAMHLVDWLKNNLQEIPEYLVYLQPTSPLRTSADIDATVRMAKQHGADAVISLAPISRKRELLYELDPTLGTISPTNEITRGALDRTHALNGAVYLVRTDVLMEKRTWYTNKTYGYIMPPDRSVDIDNLQDLLLAESILNKGNNANFAR